MPANKNFFYKHFVVFSFLLILMLTALPVLAQVNPVTNMKAAAEGTGLTGFTLPGLIGSIVKGLLGFIGVIMLLIVIYGGFLWMTAGGDPSKVKKGKDMIIQAVIGLIIVLIAYAITTFVLNTLLGLK